jgi:CheY-like chemotaxis protein/anti-sigma regulatory factor (Ser/Thr protein kinase)
MGDQQVELLVVDDEEFNRDILQDCLSEAGYGVTLAADGEEAWQILNEGKHDFASVLLDRMMPRLDGMGLLTRIKADNRYSHLPVIFQTALDNPSDIADGMKAGAFYYLTKPVSKDVTLAIVQSAVKDYRMVAAIHNDATARQLLFTLLRKVEFELSTLREAHTLADALASFFPNPQRTLLGLTELLVNAVEHGNLGISYQEKSRLLQDARWEEEIERRLALPGHAAKKVDVLVERLPQEIRATITDCGAGFDWRRYMEMSPERAFDPNGRGIAMSRMVSFDALAYSDKGNQVVATVRL